LKTAFVTGGAGFLGINLIERLVAKKWHVMTMDLTSPNAKYLQNMDVQLITGDITDPDCCKKSIPDSIDAVFHVAGNTSHWKHGNELQTLVNVSGTQNMINAALKRKVKRFIYTSSIAAYGFHPNRITEESISTAENFWINYFHTKRLAEMEVHRGIQKGLDAVILNPSNIIGAYDFSGWSRLFHLIHENRLPGVPPGRASFCHAQAVADAHISAFKNGKCGHNYLLGGEDASFHALVEQIGKLLGKKVPARPTPGFILKTIGRASYWWSKISKKEPDLTPEKALLVSSELVCSSQKAITELGYQPHSLSFMLKDCHQWLIKEKRI